MSVPDLVSQLYENVYQTPHAELVVQVYENIGTGLPPQEIPGTGVLPPPCHIPHKNWATGEEAENYFNVERWSHLMATVPYTSASTLPFRLHVPFKGWANDPEFQNYTTMERWALG